MNHKALIVRLESFVPVLPALLSKVTPEDAAWKPPSGAWSILEIVNHLVDEEVEDFRQRLRLLIEDPSAPWPPTDPEAWASKRKYNTRDLWESVGRFIVERKRSVEWLATLGDGTNWNATRALPSGRTIRAGDLLCSWAAHDALHVRQIAKRQYEMSLRDSAGFSGEYAGEWKA
ncbi:MAG: DinB family protein [Phycisphaerae bacterium]|nr:DinB family protein [Phycisphaerae bacterium]